MHHHRVCLQATRMCDVQGSAEVLGGMSLAVQAVS